MFKKKHDYICNFYRILTLILRKLVKFFLVDESVGLSNVLNTMAYDGLATPRDVLLLGWLIYDGDMDCVSQFHLKCVYSCPSPKLNGPLLLTCINVNASMDEELHPSYKCGVNYLSILKLQQCRWRLEAVKLFYQTFYLACDYQSMLGLHLTHISKGVLGIFR